MPGINSCRWRRCQTGVSGSRGFVSRHVTGACWFPSRHAATASPLLHLRPVTAWRDSKKEEKEDAWAALKPSGRQGSTAPAASISATAVVGYGATAVRVGPTAGRRPRLGAAARGRAGAAPGCGRAARHAARLCPGPGGAGALARALGAASRRRAGEQGSLAGVGCARGAIEGEGRGADRHGRARGARARPGGETRPRCAPGSSECRAGPAGPHSASDALAGSAGRRGVPPA